jgi:AraC-like DNA-binding protein
MLRNYAYLRHIHEDIVDNSKPLIVTASGYRKGHSGPPSHTERPNGRGDYQLLYVISGKVHFYFAGKEQIVSQGNMVLFRPGEPQSYYLYAADEPEMYWVHFTGSNVDAILDHYQLPSADNLFGAGTSPDYHRLFQQMIRELHLKRVNFEDLLEMNLRHIFLIINRYLREKNKIGAEMLTEIERAIHYFNENFNQNIVIEEYAKEHQMTANWFTQNFKKITKHTPMQYIISLRITSAIYMIDNTNYNMTQIASAVGYDNSLYFSRIFKKHTGMSPSEYKKKNV